MLRAIQLLKFKIRWWRWFLAAPNEAKFEFYGYDQTVRDTICERWKSKEPKRVQEH
jgi:hypothetical protein